MVWSIMKFGFWVVVTAVFMIFAYTHQFESGLTLYQLGYHKVTGELPQISFESKNDQASLNNLIERSVHKKSAN